MNPQSRLRSLPPDLSCFSPSFPFLILRRARSAPLLLSFSHPWKCLCFLEARLRPGWTITSPTIQPLEHQITYSQGTTQEAALFPSPGGRQCGTGQGPEVRLSSSPSWAPSPGLTKAFNMQSLLSTMKVPGLFLGREVRIKCGGGNEGKSPHSNARRGYNSYPSHTLPHPSPRTVSRADLNSWAPTLHG